MASPLVQPLDRAELAREFADSYGIAPNANDLIDRARLATPQAVRLAGLTQIDHVATKELDVEALADREMIDGRKPSDIGRIRVAAVRGDAISVVIERPDGTTVKGIIPANDNYVAPREPAVEAAARARTAADQRFQDELDRLRMEHAESLAELRAEFTAALQQAVPSQEEQEKAAAKVADEAAQREKEADEAPVPPPPVIGDGSQEGKGEGQKIADHGEKKDTSGAKKPGPAAKKPGSGGSPRK